MTTSKWPTTEKGAFIRRDAQFRDWIRADPQSKFPAERGRYHLYISHACPWANRTVILRNLKGLQDVISVDVVGWILNREAGGWNFDKTCGSTGDSLYGSSILKELYKMANPEAEGPISVPVLWDKKTKTIVNNESSEIIRMLNTEFNEFCPTESQRKLDLYPQDLREAIDSINEWVYPLINNGVYRSGFATTQQAYEDACNGVFEGLDKVEAILSKSRYLTGSMITEADIRLFPTLVRFDPVYHFHFKCSKKRLMDYPNTWAYTRELYQMPAFGPTVNFDHIRTHYFTSHLSINPFAIVPLGLVQLDFTEPHGRDRL